MWPSSSGPVGGVGHPPVHALAVDRLRFEEEAAQVARLEAALGLDRGQELLVVEVAVAEVPAEHQPGDHLAVDHLERVGPECGDLGIGRGQVRVRCGGAGSRALGRAGAWRGTPGPEPW